MEQAFELYEHLLISHPNEGELLLSLAEICIELDKEDEALELVQKVKKDDPLYASALLLEADLYGLNGLDEVAYKKLLEAKKIYPDEILIDFALGEQCYVQGSFQEAIQYYQTVLNEQEEIANISIHQRIAEAYSNLGQFEEALPFYEKSLEHKVELNTLFQYGLTAYQAGHYKTAIDQLMKLKAMDHEFHSLYFYLAASHEQLGEYETAFSILKEGIKQDEFNKELYFKAGKLALKLNEQDQAENYFREAIAIDPGYLEASITLSKYLIQMNRHEDCIETINSVMEFGENDPQFDWLLATCHNELENYEEANKYYTEAYEAFNQDEDFLHEYGYFLLEEGNTKLAVEQFNKLLLLSPWNEEYLSILDKLQNE